MKTKFYWFTLFASAALIAQAQGGGYHGGAGGGGRGGGSFAVSGSGSARGGGGPSFHAMPMRSFGGGGMVYSGQRFSSVGMRSPRSMEFRPQYIHSNASRSIGSQVPGNINRGDRSTRFSNAGNRAITNTRHGGNGAAQVRSGNNLPTNWRNHVVAQHSGNWQRNWDRSRDHVWRGHHCRFINGSWSSLTSDSIHGGRTGIPMITTDTGITAIRTHTTRVITTRALTTMPTPIRTVMPINRPTQSLPRRRSVLPAKAIIVVKSTVSLALKRDVRLRATKATTACALMGI